MVLVKYKYTERQSPRSSVKYQKLIMIDKDGTEVQGVMYGTDISRMQTKLQMQETWLVSNAKVVLTEAKYKMVDHIYHWVISTKTGVIKVPTDGLPRELGAPNFISLSDVPQHLNADIYIDVLGIIIDRFEPKTISGKYGISTMQDFVIVDQELDPTVITLWNDVLTTEGAAIFETTERMPIIAATRLTVSEHSGISLSAKSYSGIIVNPSYPQAHTLRTWRASNQVLLNELVTTKEYMKHVKTRAILENIDFSTIATILQDQSTGIFWIKGSVQVTNEDQNFYFMACAKCERATKADFDWDIDCNICGAMSVATPIYRFVVSLLDGESKLDALVFGEIGVKIFKEKACDVFAPGKDPFKISVMNEQLKGRMFDIEVKKKVQEITYEGGYQYTISSIEEKD